MVIYFTGALFKTTENNCKFSENRCFTQLAMDFYVWPEYETLFLQLEFRWWTCKYSIDWHVSYNRWAARYDNTNTHSIKILLCGLAHGEVLPPDEANVSENFTVTLCYFTQSCWAQWQSCETLKGRSLLKLCIIHLITILIIFISTEYPGNSPVGNSSYQAGKPVTLSVRGIVQLENDICFFIIKNVNKWC